LWDVFLKGITQSDAEFSAYLQRLGGYCVRGVASKDVLAYFFGVGSNGKSSFAEALAPRKGDYAMVFTPEVLMEGRTASYRGSPSSWAFVSRCAARRTRR
jgi:putative DNA primase/helicase